MQVVDCLDTPITDFTCCSLSNSGNTLCNKVTTCFNAAGGGSVTCVTGDYGCYVIRFYLDFIVFKSHFFFTGHFSKSSWTKTEFFFGSLIRVLGEVKVEKVEILPKTLKMV